MSFFLCYPCKISFIWFSPLLWPYKFSQKYCCSFRKLHYRLFVCLGFCVWSYSNSLDPESLSLCLSRISVVPPELIHTTTHRCITALAVNLWCMSVEHILISCLTLGPSIMEYTKGAMKCVKYVSLFWIYDWNFRYEHFKILAEL